jgi:uncharacterized protein Veg
MGNTASALELGEQLMEGGFMLLEKNTLIRIRKDIERYIGKDVILKANKGRKKTIIREGVLEAAYPNLFVVRISNEYESSRKVSYTYTDVLTGTVEVTICAQTQSQVKIS